MGERAILVRFSGGIRPDLLNTVLEARKRLLENIVEVKVHVINTYDSLAVIYPTRIEKIYEEVLQVEYLLEDLGPAPLKGNREYRIPVCYHQKFALDLIQLSVEKDLEPRTIVDLHTAGLYTVYFLGFLPGFPYLGGLDERLHTPRRNSPRSQVMKGAVGIGGEQTGIYPEESPGGWHIIGNCPIRLFDPGRNPPCQIQAGDRLRFYEISLEEHRGILEASKTGTYQLERI